MRKTFTAIAGVVALCLMSCMVVVDGEDHHEAKKNDPDTVTVIFSQSPTGIAASSAIDR